MAGIYTGSIAAEVVNLKSILNGPEHLLVGPSSRTGASASNLKSRIAVFVSLGLPFPASAGKGIDFAPKATRNGKLGAHRKVTPFGAMQPEATLPRGCFPLYMKE